MNERIYEQQKQQLLQQSWLNWPGLSGWNFYFLLKIGLAAFNLINLQLISNLLFIALLLVPIKWLWLRWIRQLLALVAATALLYQESYLPPFSRLTAQWQQVSDFSVNYWLELLARFVPLNAIAILLVAWILYLYVAPRLRLTLITLLALLTLPLWQPMQAPPVEALPRSVNSEPLNATASQTPSQFLQQFYARQQQLKTDFANLTDTGNMDILLVNICSLSWDDLTSQQLMNHPLLSRQDIIFQQYNSATSYSGPAALRILRAGCGQSSHQDLYQPAAAQCLLASSLAELGWKPELWFNHTGDFDNFRQSLQQYGGFAGIEPASLSGIDISMRSFDQSPVYDDAQLLQQWLAQLDPQRPRFSFYNTVSLHDGNRIVNSSLSSLRSYGQRTEQLLNTLNQLYDAIERSGKPVLVVIVPEHGSGLRGDKLQLPGMREIPSPTITHVPVFIRLFGPQVNGLPAPNLLVEKVTSPHAISEAIYTILAQQPFTGGVYNPSAVADNVEATDWVAENQAVVVLRYYQQLLLKLGMDDWIAYPQQ